jgi:hypothetical protein
MTTTVRLSIGNRAAVGLTVTTVTQRPVTGHSTGWDLTLTGAPPTAVVVTDKIVSGGKNFLIKEISGSVVTVVGDAFFHTDAPVSGAATSDRSFANHYQIFTLCSSRDMRVLDWMYVTEYWREGGGPNGEWLFDRNSSPASLVNCLGDPGRHLVVTAAPGHGFIDAFASTNHALRYDPTLGVALKVSGQFAFLFTTSNNTPSAQGSGYLQVHGLMIDGTGLVVFDGGGLGAAFWRTIANSCIVTNGVCSNTIEAVNTVFYTPGASLAGGNSAFKCTNCTMISTAGTGAMITPGNYMSAWFKNCAVFGFTALSSNPAKIIVAQSYRLATDLASDGTTGIPGSIYNLDEAVQYISIVAGAEDIQLKATSALIGAGLYNSDTLDKDITGRPRSTTNPSIGASEVPWYPVIPVAPKPDRVVSRGLWRGIERGVL